MPRLKLALTPVQHYKRISSDVSR
jgi:hypothetical protein